MSRYLTILVLLACAFPLPGCNSDSGHETAPRWTQANIDPLVSRLPLYSGSIVVAQDGRITAEANVGTADIASGSAIYDKTVFSIASVGTMFTAVAIIQLVEAGKLALDTAITEPAGRLSESVTIDNLLRHRSGIQAVSGEYDLYRRYAPGNGSREYSSVAPGRPDDVAPQPGPASTIVSG